MGVVGRRTFVILEQDAPLPGALRCFVPSPKANPTPLTAAERMMCPLSAIPSARNLEDTSRRPLLGIHLVRLVPVKYDAEINIHYLCHIHGTLPSSNAPGIFAQTSRPPKTPPIYGPAPAGFQPERGRRDPALPQCQVLRKRKEKIAPSSSTPVRQSHAKMRRMCDV